MFKSLLKLVFFLFFTATLFGCDNHTNNLVDTTKPIMTLVGDPTVALTTDDQYVEKGALAKDEVDGQLEVNISGTVNTTVSGEYIITYSAHDSWGNKVTTTRTVFVKQADHEKPVITITGEVDVLVEVNTSYEDAGATVTDNIDTALEITTINMVDPNKVGSYTVTYTATDSAGNKATAVRHVTVKVFDHQKPVITLNGRSAISIVVGTPYIDAGATATDDVDPIVNIVTINNVDATVVGEYTVTYTATDSSGNSATATRIVTVKEPDTEKPVISLKGKNPLRIVQDTAYEDAGATVTDNEDDTVKLVIDNKVNINIPGSYVVIYTAKDKSGNEATATRIVEVVRAKSFKDFDGVWLGKCQPSTLPTAIAVRHKKSIQADKLVDTISTFNKADCSDTPVSTLQVYSDITYLGEYTSSVCTGDKVDFDITFVTRDGVQFSNITTFAHDFKYPVFDIVCLDNQVLYMGKTTALLDGSTADKRPAEFDFSTQGGFITFNETAPVISIIGEKNLIIDQGENYVDAGATATDDVDPVVKVVTTGDVDTATPGLYVITYTATDSSGNTATATRNVTVKAVASEESYTGTWKSQCEANTNVFLKTRGVVATSSSLFVSNDRMTTQVTGYNNKNCAGGVIYTGTAIANYAIGSDTVAQPINFCAGGKANRVDMVITAAVLNGKVLSDKELLTFLNLTKAPVYNLLCIDPSGSLRSGDTSNGFDGTTSQLRPVLMNMTGAGYTRTAFSYN